jgi:hypothetical protein
MDSNNGMRHPYIKFSGTAVSLLSCGEDTMDEVNEHPNLMTTV